MTRSLRKEGMNLLQLEELVYDFGDLNHKIGRVETDGTTSQAQYNKMVDKRDVMRQRIRETIAAMLGE